MRRPEHTEDRSPVELPWSLIQGGSFLTAFQAAQHITILTLLCSAKEKLWWKHNWETGKSLYVCECVCVCECAWVPLYVRVHVVRSCTRACVCACVSSLSVFVHVCKCLCVCVCNNKGRTTMGNQAVSSCNFMFSNYLVDTVFLSVRLLAEIQGLIFWFIFMLIIQLNYQGIKPNWQYVWKKFFKWRVILPNIFCHFINVVS